MKLLKKIKKRLLVRLGSWLASILIRFIRKTTRIEVKGREHFDEALALDRGVILAFWHGGMLVPMMAHVGMDVGVLVGEHEDGELIARVLSSFGFPLVRGSATRGGRHAMAGMTERLRANKIMAITPDGPSGPYHECKAGLVVLASRTGTPILPKVSASSHSITLKSWDRFRIVMPFSRCILRYGNPVLPDGDGRTADARALAREIEKILERLEREAMAEAGVKPSGLPVFPGKRSENPVFMERILRVAAFIYKSIVIMRNKAYDEGIFRERTISAPVISIGNISLGGTGKTPTTLMLAEYFMREGMKPAVVSRGYKRKTKGMRVATDGNVKAADWREAGDEAMLMANSLSGVPVLVFKNRYKAAVTAIRTFGCDVILLDDGFQHRRLKRDLDIVLVSAGRSIGDDAVFPDGFLREPASGLARADLLIVTKAKEGTEQFIEELRAYSNAPIFRAGYLPMALRRYEEGGGMPLEEWREKTAVAFAGLADPDSFFGTLAAAGIRLLRTEYYPDHYEYTHRDWRTLSAMLERTGADILVTTEKDAIRIDKSWLPGVPLYVLESEWKIEEDADSFFRIVRSAVPFTS